MKILYTIALSLFTLVSYAQIEQNVNKNNGTTQTTLINEIDSIRFNGSLTNMEVILQNGNVESHLIDDIDNVTFSGELIGEISDLECSNATISDDIISGLSANGINLSLPYTGGNGGFHNGEIVNSTGVTGLTATLQPGNFENGNGTLIYEITGTANIAGNASFTFDIGGQTCSFSIPVLDGTIDDLLCQNTIINGTLEEGSPATAVSFSIPYTGGNGGPYPVLSFASTVVTGLTAEANAGVFDIGSGNITFTVTGTPSSSGAAFFDITIGGETCTLEIPVNPSSGGCPTLNIGDQFGGGIVVDINYPGAPCGYLIVRENNDDNLFSFIMANTNCFQPSIAYPNPPTRHEIGEGASNSAWLATNCNGTPADVCENSAHAGFNDWFLPTKDEVELLLQNWSANNYVSGQTYFTSTFGATPFTINGFQNAVRLAEPGVVSSTITISNNLERPVRCVRSF